MKIIDYSLQRLHEVELHEGRMSQLIKAGWQPLGEPKLVEHRIGDHKEVYLYQVIVKYEESKPCKYCGQ